MKERNDDFHTINQKLEMGHIEYNNSKNDNTKYTVSENYDIIFWMGDLNYRINGNRNIMDELIRNQMFGN